MVNRVNSVSGPHHLRVESGVLVSGVMYSTGGAICLQQLGVPYDFVTVARLMLFLDVLRVCVLHTVLEFIFGMGL
jgi:hypothetical protein